jgi:hypothetical protein
MTLFRGSRRFPGNHEGCPRRPAGSGHAMRRNRSSVSVKCRTSSIRAAAWAFGLARPCSHFSRVRSFMNNRRAKSALEHSSFSRVSRMNCASTSGSAFWMPAQARSISLCEERFSRAAFRCRRSRGSHVLVITVSRSNYADSVEHCTARRIFQKIFFAPQPVRLLQHRTPGTAASFI